MSIGFINGIPVIFLSGNDVRSAARPLRIHNLKVILGRSILVSRRMNSVMPLRVISSPIRVLLMVPSSVPCVVANKLSPNRYV